MKLELNLKNVNFDLRSSLAACDVQSPKQQFTFTLISRHFFFRLKNVLKNCSSLDFFDLYYFLWLDYILLNKRFCLPFIFKEIIVSFRCQGLKRLFLPSPTTDHLAEACDIQIMGSTFWFKKLDHFCNFFYSSLFFTHNLSKDKQWSIKKGFLQNYEPNLIHRQLLTN